MPRNKKKGNKVAEPPGGGDQVTQSQVAAQVYQQPQAPQVEEEWRTQDNFQKRQERRKPQPEERRQTQYQMQEPGSSQSKRYSNPSSRGGYSQQDRGQSSRQPNWRGPPRQSTQETQSQSQNVWGKPRAGQETSSKEVFPKRQPQTDTSKSIQTRTRDLQLQNKEAGTAGRPILLETNHFRIDFGDLEKVYHYDIEIEPKKSKRILREVFEQIRKKHFGEIRLAFDGMKNIISPCEVLEAGKVLTDVIEMLIPNKSKADSFKVTFKLSTVVDLAPLRNMGMTGYQQAVQCVDIVLRSGLAMRSIPAGRSFFNQSQVIDIGGGKLVYCGIYQAVTRGWKQCFFNVDVAHKVFPSAINVVDLMAEMASSFKQKVTPKDFENGKSLPRYVEENVEKHLSGLRVLYEAPGMKKQVTVNGLGPSARNAKFTDENGKTVTVENYFKTSRNYRLRFPMLPTVWVGKKERENKILLPAEMCTVVPNQTVPMHLNDMEKTNMIRSTATSTIERKKKIMNSMEEARHNEDACIREFGFSIGSTFEELEGRVLTPPALEYHDKALCIPAKGVWRQNNVPFLKGAQRASWVIISLCGKNLAPKCAEFADMISKMSRKQGMGLEPKPGPFDFIDKDRPIFADVKRILEKHSKYDIVFVIIYDKKGYSLVKQAAELHLTILTQCILSRTLNRMDPSTVGNILLKVNAKLNGINHCLNEIPEVLKEPCMIMGADVTHPSPQSRNIPSVAAVTASHDPNLFKYSCRWVLQPPKVEIISDLEAITRGFLLNYYKKCGQQKPRKIIMFRDGVSEGQFEMVKSTEMGAIQKACRSLEADYQPKITFVTVQKRHHTRFFPKFSKDSEDKNCNVPAGTCVDTVITNPEHKDFYLVPHASIQGVAKPTKFTTLYDDNDFSYDDIEQLAFYLCHLFSRCNRSVSYPAPTYYAHLVADRAKNYIENRNIDLDNLEKEQKKIENEMSTKYPMFFV